MTCRLWSQVRAMVLAAGTLLSAAPSDLFVDFAAAVPSGPVYTGIPVELFATMKVSGPLGMDRETLLTLYGFNPEVTWKTRQGSFSGASRVVLGDTTKPPNGLVFVTRCTFVPPALPGTCTISVVPEVEPGKAITLEIKVEDLGLAIHPSSATLAPGQEQPFRATFQGPPETPLQWTATGGVISAQRLYRAPREPGAYVVSVRHLPSGKRASARILVANPFEIEPSAPELAVGQTLRFQAQGALAWSVLEPGGGRIDADGTYTAPRAPGVYRVVALRPPLKAQATVTVGPLTLAISPEESTLGMGQRLQFMAKPSHGTCLWSASAGEITDEGLFHAPLEAGTCRITARSTLDASVSATAVVEVVAPGQVQIQPDVVSLHVGQVQQFLALGLPAGAAPTWLVQPPTAGEITDDGRFTAGPRPGPCSVLVLLEDMMSSAAVELIDTRIFPDPARIRPGGSLPFKVQGLPGGVPVSWTVQPADLGVITGEGHFTAGPNPGEGRINASAGGIETSAALSILTSRISPERALVLAGEKIRFTGETYGLKDPRLTWRLLGSQPGARLEQDGSYQAPVLQGIYRISATDASGHISYAVVTVGPPKSLVVIPEINVLRDGIYSVRVRLRASNGRSVESLYTGELHQGLAYPEVVFPVLGRLDALEADGPYTLARITISGSTEGESVVFDTREDLGPTEPFLLQEAQRNWIRIDGTLEARGRDLTEAGLFRSLAVSVPLEVASEGEYRVSATLATGNGTEIEARSEVLNWSRGLQTVEFRFDGHRIHALGASGPLSLTRFTVEGPVTRTRDFPDAIRGFDFRMFEP